MTGFSTWWRKAGGMLAAVVLAVMVFGPTAEAAVCADGPATVVATAVLDQPGDAAAGADQSPCGDAQCPCEHCQCHHAGASAPVALSDTGGPSAVRSRHALADGPAPGSSLILGLKRPPRS